MAKIIQCFAAMFLLLQLLLELMDLLLELAVLLGQELELLFVTPLKYIAALSVQGVTIVLLMA